jgi:hypothetical protein
MTNKMQVLPVQCKRCKGIFDLWYDLQEIEKSGRKGGLEKFFRESLCWNCRKQVLRDVAKSIAKEDDAVVGENIKELLLEIELE